MWIDVLHHWDEVATLWLNQWHSPLTDQMMVFLSDKKVWIPVYAAVALMLIRRLGWKKALVMILTAGLTFLACDQCSSLIKDSVARLRPCYNRYMIEGGIRILEGRGSLFGFFSAHAANVFGFAWVTCLGWKNDPSYDGRPYAWFIFTWAVLVSLSRIFVGKHFLGDVLAGALIGSILGYAFVRLGNWFIAQFLERDASSSAAS